MHINYCESPNTIGEKLILLLKCIKTIFVCTCIVIAVIVFKQDILKMNAKCRFGINPRRGKFQAFMLKCLFNP